MAALTISGGAMCSGRVVMAAGEMPPQAQHSVNGATEPMSTPQMDTHRVKG